MLAEEYIITDKYFRDNKSLFKHVYRMLLEKDMVSQDFEQALLQREKEFPTGLDTGEIKIAIPHTDCLKVKKEALVVVIPKRPIAFREMGKPHNIIMADIIFFPLIKDRQVKFLSGLLNNIKNSDILNSVYKGRNKEEICRLLKKSLNI